jgi:hypothetical protein
VPLTHSRLCSSDFFLNLLFLWFSHSFPFGIENFDVPGFRFLLRFFY